jgi:hypothetical protein
MFQDRIRADGSLDVSELCKAIITLMVLVTTLVGFLFGWHGTLNLLFLFQTRLAELTEAS